MGAPPPKGHVPPAAPRFSGSARLSRARSLPDSCIALSYDCPNSKAGCELALAAGNLIRWKKRRVGLCLALVLMMAAALACTSGEPPVVFTSNRDGNLEIYSVRVSDKVETNLTRRAADDFAPQVSPNRSMVAFLSRSAEGVALEAMTVNGEEWRRVADGEGDYYGHRWSPDASRLAYVAESSERTSIYFNNADGTQPMPLSSIESGDVGGWSPDGASLSFAVGEGAEMGIYVRNPDGVNEDRLTETPDAAPIWSPDARRFAFISTRDGNPEVYVMNVDGSEQKRLTATDAPEYAVSWSPNGRSLLFVSERDGNPEIYVMRVDGDGEEPARLTRNEVRDGHPVWSPNGDRIAFVSYLDGDAEIFVMSADGEDQERLTNNEFEDTEPSW